MAIKGKVRNMFPGGNTCKGFYSFYKYLIEDDANRIFIIKGGPGTGKSTFMRKIAQEMVDKGYDVELHHCSSDNNSLDGVVITSLRVALIDGTAPHIVDPKNPGAVDEIIHLGDYWNEAKLVEKKQEIIACNKQISKHFNNAYLFLKEAKIIHDEWESYYIDAMDFNIANKKTNNLIQEIFADTLEYNQMGKERHLFASALTPKGPVDFLANLTDDATTRYIIKGRPGTGKSTMTKKVAQYAISRGYNVEMFHCSFDPDSVDAIYIPELRIAMIDGTAPHVFDPVRTGDKIVDMLECVDPAVVQKYQAELKDVERRYQEVMAKAVENVAKAKKEHDLLETYYVAAMDFEAIEQVRVKTLQRILAIAGKS